MIKLDILSIMLSIIATPIGNLKDITLRALEVLHSVDGIICEDTRRTVILLNHYQIKKPLLVLNDFNESSACPKILQKLINQENLALVSDAGTPLISDPGYKLVRACLEAGVDIDSLPGPSSIITALTLSGLPPDKFLYLGYLPEKPGHRLKLLQNVYDREQSVGMKATYITLVSPHKLIRVLGDISQVFGDIPLCLASELTKIHQSVKTEKVSLWINKFSKNPPKGEFVMLFNLAK